MTTRNAVCGVLLGALVLTSCAASEPGARFNLDLATFGGLQLWSDVAWSEGARVQRHAWTGHHRLLDASNVRRAWGSEAHCRDELDALEEGRVEPAPEGQHLVVLLHGLWRTRASLARMQQALEQDGYRVATLSYASSQGTVDEHAACVARVLDRQRGVERVSFVTHSLGSRVVQRLTEREDAWRERIDLAHVVQLAPPNQGSRLARAARHLAPVRWVFGPTLDELIAPSPRTATESLGVIAGVRGQSGGWNPLLGGDDDGVVSLRETRAGQPHEHLSVEAAHTFVMNDAEAIEATRRFLRTGAFAPDTQSP